MKYWSGGDMAMRQIMPAKTSEAGYTLTELLVVLVILGLIAAAITPRVIGRLDSSKVRAAKLQTDTLAASLDLFYIDTGRYPTSEEGLAALLAEPSEVAGWDGPYVRTSGNLIDPWGAAYLYTPTEEDTPARVITYGSDGAVGGEGTAADLQFPE